MTGARFLLDGEIIAPGPVDPTGTLLDWLRTRARRTGTKEGCAEGDCGACTVLVGELAGDGMAWRAVNACILFLPALDGKALLTVESLGTPRALHPVQQAMVERHGSQCGFCTPGIVMSLYARSIDAAGSGGSAADLLGGNLCRCTGYGPILDVARDIVPEARDDGATIAALQAIQRDAALDFTWADPIVGTTRRWIAPRTADEFAAVMLRHPDARIVAGATDVGLWVTKMGRIIDTVVSIADIADLRDTQDSDAGLTIGAGVRYAEAQAALGGLHPDLGELVRRIAGAQVRNAGTIGGNIANGSPIGDMPPALIALGATLTLRRGDERRTMPLEDYFLAYGKQDRQPGEWVESVFVPRPAPTDIVRIVKLSKRFDSDISAVCAAIRLTMAGEIVTAARIAFGGMAGTPKRAPAAEAALTGAPLSAASLDSAARALAEDYQPLDDLRGTSAYRLEAAGNILRRMWHERSAPAGLLALEAVDG
ncbi:xanthine dehydrogenase small subunit [Sphingomonas naphthae]|uniref:Xanthine dehydrogenase small subunit n=1 Tax=Sphingomonas naphthae TaxID=1813468 RepID=A0ABY7TLT3_9SPHN|nr:xanthine dehydrogenase small subunit [Sphingomonas naphthae]WCT73721.1 xanthine dehydrogenase small subunit [Sphingomonas naphthae]